MPRFVPPFYSQLLQLWRAHVSTVANQVVRVYDITQPGPWELPPSSLPCPDEDDVCVYRRRNDQDHCVWIGRDGLWARADGPQVSRRLGKHNSSTSPPVRYHLYTTRRQSTQRRTPAAWVLPDTLRKYDGGG